jgi:hypothetical protein
MTRTLTLQDVNQTFYAAFGWSGPARVFRDGELVARLGPFSDVGVLTEKSGASVADL